jgi:hypothetical protein
MIKKAVRSGLLPGLIVSAVLGAAILIPAGGAFAAVCYAYPTCQIYTSEAFGGIHNDGGTPAITNQPTFAKALARAAHMAPGTPAVGLVLDAYGGLHPYGSPGLVPSAYPYYPGVDIARDFVFIPSGAGGYELDGFGGIHPFSVGGSALPPAPSNYPYFTGNDVARKITLLAAGTGGYVLDIFGGIHPWSVTGSALPAAISQYGYWPGANVARDIWVDPAATAVSASGYVIDLYGGFHPFWSAAAAAPVAIVDYPYWTGRDLARAMWVQGTPATAAGYVLDAYGGIHPFAGSGQPLPPAIFPFAYWIGQDLARNLFGG